MVRAWWCASGGSCRLTVGALLSTCISGSLAHYESLFLHLLAELASCKLPRLLFFSLFPPCTPSLAARSALDRAPSRRVGSLPRARGPQGFLACILMSVSVRLADSVYGRRRFLSGTPDSGYQIISAEFYSLANFNKR